MKYFISFLILGLSLINIPSIVYAESRSVSDTIHADDTWDADTIRVEGEITLMDDVTLTILPGTRIEFQGHYGIKIMGTIIADGRESDSIIFTMPLSDTAGFYKWYDNEGSWGGIYFDNTAGQGADGNMHDNDTSRLDHCIFEYTKSSKNEDAYYAGIEVTDFSRLIISNCEFRNNRTHYRGGAIRAYTNSDIIIRDNHIHHNTAWEWGGAIYLHNSGAFLSGNIIEYNEVISKNPGAQRAAGGGIGIIGMKPDIRNNIIRYNMAVIGAGIHMVNSFGVVAGNTISYNMGHTDLPPDTYSKGGGMLMESGSSPKIINNSIANNISDEGGGLFVVNSDPVIFGNLIVNNTANFTSGGLFSISSSEDIVNNTFANNKAPIGAAIEFNDSEPLFKNNIVWNNLHPSDKQIKLLGYFVKLHVQNSIIENGASSFEGESSPTFTQLIEDDPEFVGPSLGEGAGFEGLDGMDWSVEDSSSCVNKGNNNFSDLPVPSRDIYGGKRINHSIIDIGAYEALITSLDVKDTIKQNTTWIADTVHLKDNLVIADDVTLTILPGTWIKADGRYRIDVLGTIIAAGTENNPIHFTVADTAGNWDKSIPDGSWRGIFIDNEAAHNIMADNQPSLLRHCYIGYVKSLEDEAFQHSALMVNKYSGLSLSHCTFFENSARYESAGIMLRFSNIDISNCRFYNNYGGNGPCIWTENSDFTVDNCYFEDNRATGGPGGAINSQAGSITISNSEFYHNSTDGRGGAVFMQRTEAKINHNHFVNNYADGFGGAICAQYENILLTNNIITNNTGNAGGGVYGLYIDEAVSINNTICNNFALNGGGMYGAFVNHTSINDILYGNDVEYDGKQYGMYSVSATIIFRNTNIEGGTEGIGFWQGQELTGTYTNLMDSLPEFIRPSEGPGNDFMGTNSSWNLKSISPCINNGSLNGISLLSDEDIWGNPRIFDSLIDIGAFESQYGPPEIRFHPENYIGCVGDTVELNFGVRFKSFYQWKKNGEDIGGATEKILKLENISREDDGNYQCIVSNSHGSVETNSIYLLARAAPEFIRQPENTWTIQGEKTIIQSNSVGDQPIDLQWFKDGELLPGKVWPDLWINNTDSINEGLYHCEATNACATVSSDTVQLYISPQICMVTVDTTDRKNLIIWEKHSSAPISSYNIYRESIVAGEYEAIGNVDGNALSEFTDTTAKPAQQAYIYKITAVMEDGRESGLNLCRPHRTIHLLTSKNTEYNVAQLDWDDYYGFDYGTFFIFRNSRELGDFNNYHSMASSTNEWTDIDAIPGELYYYRVAVEPPEPCNPTGGNTKGGTGPYKHSLSNMDDNKLKVGMEDVVMGGLNIYPNPFSQGTTIEFPNPELAEYRIMIRNLAGKVVQIKTTNGNQVFIERGNLSSGIYSIELSGKKIYRDKIVVR